MKNKFLMKGIDILTVPIIPLISVVYWALNSRSYLETLEYNWDINRMDVKTFAQKWYKK